MNTIEKVQHMTEKNLKSYEGGKIYQASFRETLIEFFSLGLLNGNFYQNEEDVLKHANELYMRALKEEPEFATKCAIYGATVNSLKLVPIIWLVYLSTLEDKTLFQKAFPRIIRNPKMLNDFVNIARKGGIRQGLGRGVKKVINEWLVDCLNDYQVSRNKGKLEEVVKVSRPKCEEKTFQNYMAYLVKGELTFPRAIYLKKTIDVLNEGKLDEEVLQWIDRFQLQLEELKHATKNLDQKQKQELYTHIYKGLNYSALILNLVALERVFATQTKKSVIYKDGHLIRTTRVIETDIPSDLIDMVANKIKDVKAYRKSNMLPFALINAESMVVTPEFKRAINDMLKIVSSEAFLINEETELMVVVDNSSSMGGMINSSLRCSNIASLFGALLKKSHAKTNVYAVANYIKPVNLAKQEEVFEMKRKIECTDVGHGTYLEQAMKQYNHEKYLIVITDSEQADDLESQWLHARKPCGAKMIVWQLQPYYHKISNDPSVIYVRGYSDRLLSLIKNIIENNIAQIEEIEKIKL